ncbi:MAG: ABC transporter ATP-binding protein [Thermoanaerobacterales bacterium]|nr:ABC transporter ATP-binding protein [Thermoanaerobacterales bacterium]
MIDVLNLAVTYQQHNATVPAIADISLHLDPGHILAVIGPSGCGKTSLLYVLAGLRPPSAGRVTIDGEPVQPGRLKTAVILQDYGLLPWKTVWQNTILGLEVRRAPRAEIISRCRSILAELGLDGLSHLYPAQLSGGQRQRVAIARALALEPDLLLMDEPFSSLDALTRESLQDGLLDVWAHRGVSMVIVTHSIEEAVYLGQSIIVLSPRPARVIATVENPGVGRPSWRRSPEFHRVCTRLRDLLEGKGEHRPCFAAC